MLKQLIMAVTPLLIYDAPKAIQYAQVILDSIMLAQYISLDEEILCYIEYTLYMVKKSKILFEQYQFIDSKLYQPTFNYPKFYIISDFIKCIWDYGSAVNYNIAYSEAVHKYLFQAFYNKRNKIEYKL